MPPDSEGAAAAVVVPEKEAVAKPDRKRQPRYHVVLWDSDEHSYWYVIKMLKELFGHEEEKGFQLAKKVDNEGRTVVLTTTLEHAELKRDQIHAYGKDETIKACKGSMKSSVEPES
ncbi:MAG: Clp protease ClpS [Planctomycetaceae bacterium]|nr:Clp protease ClpS [Planctomycetaceae bacterium]